MVDHLTPAIRHLGERRRQLDRAERTALQPAEERECREQQQDERDRHEHRDLVVLGTDRERRGEREDEDPREEPEGVPHDVSVAEEVQARGERGRAELEDEEQQRVDDPDEGHDTGPGDHQRLRGPAAGRRDGDRYLRDDQAEPEGDEHVEQLDAGRAEPSAPALFEAESWHDVRRRWPSRC
jgi:hypothetical protein